MRTLDDKTGARQLSGAFGTHQEGHILTAGLQQPAAEIATGRAGPDNENAHRSVLFCLLSFFDEVCAAQGSFLFRQISRSIFCLRQTIGRDRCR